MNQNVIRLLVAHMALCRKSKERTKRLNPTGIKSTFVL